MMKIQKKNTLKEVQVVILKNYKRKKKKKKKQINKIYNKTQIFIQKKIKNKTNIEINAKLKQKNFRKIINIYKLVQW